MKKLQAEHRWIVEPCEEQKFGYFGWPTVARLKDNTLVAASSGYRDAHLSPYGKSVLFRSTDNGKTWSGGEVINNSPVDDRDCGLLALPDGGFALSWFGSDTRYYRNLLEGKYEAELANWDDQTVTANLGCFIRICDKKGDWSRRRIVPVTSPHGPVSLKDGKWLFVGTLFARKRGGKYVPDMKVNAKGIIQCFTSADQGETWQPGGVIPDPGAPGRFCEPHAIELEDGSFLALMRRDPGNEHFAMWQTISHDCGRTWSMPVKIHAGSPPHLMRHSSGVIVCSCGWRTEPFGQRVIFSTDEGKTWSDDYILRDDGVCCDLGYASSVELPDGSMLTCYYQGKKTDGNCGIAVSRWRLPEELRKFHHSCL